jgi:hypothetical protein
MLTLRRLFWELTETLDSVCSSFTKNQVAFVNIIDSYRADTLSAISNHKVCLYGINVLKCQFIVRYEDVARTAK